MELLSGHTTQMEQDVLARIRVYEKQVADLFAAFNSNARTTVLENRIRELEKRISYLEDIYDTEERASETIPLQSVVLQNCIEGLQPTVSVPPPSPALNSAVLNSLYPQRTLVIDKLPADTLSQTRVEPEPEPEALLGELAEQTGGLEQESECAPSHKEEDDCDVNTEEENAEDAEEEGAENELEPFPWKGKTYYKDANDLLWRADVDGNVEDEPFAKFDSVNNRLTKIVPST